MSFFPAAAQREINSRLKDVPKWIKQTTTPIVSLEVRNKEGIDFSMYAKKRCKVAKGRKEWYSAPFTSHCMIEALKSVVD